MINSHAAYRALTSRDPRFDGIFFVGVTSTGVYCRPICPVKTPLQKNCRFFENAFAAEKAVVPSVPALPAGIGAGPRADR